MNSPSLRRLASACLLGAVTSATFSTAAYAQNRSASAVLLEEIVVTARKRDESSLDVPLAITALGADQLDALKVRDI